ncbi:MAG: 1-aminocyclopropane-1-carboxylate deaminase/D-cysteine desulfhydrase [Promethearchaeota archaeon]
MFAPKKIIPLYRRYPKLEKIPRVSIIQFPTPVNELKQVSRILGGFNLWVKRDDLTSSKYGGNKPRKFEFAFAYALKKKKTRIITVGGTGTNQGLACTILAQEFGLKTSLFLTNQPLTHLVRENLLCDHHFGAQLYYTKTALVTKWKLLLKLISNKHFYYLCVGASNPLGTIGFVNAGLELADQIEAGLLPEPDKIFVALGSIGMAVGLAIGIELAGLKTKLIGVAVTPESYNNKRRIMKLAKQTNKLLRKADPSIPNVAPRIFDRLSVDRSFFGGEYGRWTREGIAAMKMFNIEDPGYQLEPVYTAKVFSALIAYCQENPKAKSETILYWHSRNSVDLSLIYSQVDYHALPQDLHVLFDGTIPLDENLVQTKL